MLDTEAKQQAESTLPTSEIKQQRPRKLLKSWGGSHPIELFLFYQVKSMQLSIFSFIRLFIHLLIHLFLPAFMHRLLLDTSVARGCGHNGKTGRTSLSWKSGPSHSG